MDITTCVDTSLNLNVVPPSNHTEHVAAEVLVEELHRLSSENKKLMETLKQMCDDYVALQKHLSEFSINKQHLPSNFEKEELIIASSTPSSSSWKRKAESEIMSNKFGVTTECSTTTADNEVAVFKRPFRHDASPKVSKIIVRTDASDTTSLYVRDGYQWRKYGQKVTRDNPSPRAYFRCSFAPNCPVKKKVQRSAEDPTLLVATYEGEHNHHNEAEISLMSCSTSSTATCSSPPRHQSSTESPTLMNGIIAGATPPTTVTADLVKSGLVAQKSSSSIIMQQQQQQFLVHQMATSLTQDPNFTAALATAISGTILDHASIVKTR